MGQRKRRAELEVSQRNTDLLTRAREAWQSICESGWRFAELVAEVAHTRAYCPDFLTLEEWAFSIGIKSKGTVSKFRRAGEILLQQPPEQRQRWRNLPISRLTETPELMHFALRNPEGAYEIISQVDSRAAIREMVADRDADQHLDLYRSLTIPVAREVRPIWEEACNVVRFLAGDRELSLGEIVERIAAEIRDLPLGGGVWEERRDEVWAGQVRCRECGSWNAADLDRHHVIPRSHGGHDGPLVYLCRSCHDRIQPRWREWATAQGFMVADVA